MKELRLSRAPLECPESFQFPRCVCCVPSKAADGSWHDVSPPTPSRGVTRRRWSRAGNVVALLGVSSRNLGHRSDLVASFTGGIGERRGMLGAVRSAVFGPSRADRRRAVSAYLDKLKAAMPGETFACAEVIEDYDRFAAKIGAPKLRPDVLMQELAALGCQSFEAIKVPWPMLPDGGGRAALPPPATEAQATVAAPAATAPKQQRSRRETVSAPVARLSRDAALSDLRARLERGEVIPSQQDLADRWGINKGTASKWLGGWEAAGLIPRRVSDGPCNVIFLPAARMREAC